MFFFYPRSFWKLLLVGFALAMLPLGYAFYYAASALTKLANQSQRAVYEAVQITQGSKTLRDRLTDLERVARQYIVLSDAALLQNYRRIHEEFSGAARALMTNPLDPEQRVQLKLLVEREERIFTALDSGGAQTPETKAMVTQYEALGRQAHDLFAKSDTLIERKVDAMRRTTSRAQGVTFWLTIMLVPIALLVAFGVSLIITRPIDELEAAINRIGDGQLDVPVAVRGPDDLVTLGKRLDWLRLRLKELEQQKSKFLQRVSHELKTPLTAIREGSELLADEVGGRLTAQQHEIATILRHKGMQLQKLIENLLKYSATEFHKTLPRPRPTNLLAAVEKVAEEHKLALRARDIQLNLAGGPLTVDADPEMLHVVVDNLLSNAIKFSPQRGTIIISQYSRGEQAVLEVTDQGPGVAEQEARHIFDAFYEGTAPTNSPVKGSGLGLAICRDYVRAHQGSIEVLRHSGRGATFRVSLPFHQEATS